MSGRCGFSHFILYFSSLRKISQKRMGSFSQIEMGMDDNGSSFPVTYDSFYLSSDQKNLPQYFYYASGLFIIFTGHSYIPLHSREAINHIRLCWYAWLSYLIASMDLLMDMVYFIFFPTIYSWLKSWQFIAASDIFIGFIINKTADEKLRQMRKKQGGICLARRMAF